MYVILNNDTGKYVSSPALNKVGCSYTVYLQEARIFTTFEAAKPHCCGNEQVISLQSLLGHNVDDSNK